jgi:hypothetical protein
LGIKRLDGVMAVAAPSCDFPLTLEGTGDLIVALVFLGEAGKKRFRRDGLEGGMAAPPDDSPMSAKASL